MLLELEKGFAGKEVTKYPMAGPDNMATPHYGLFTEGGECVGNAVRKGYEPHTIDDVSAITEAVLEGWDLKDGDYKLSTHWHHGHTVVIAPTKEYRKTVMGSSTKEDTIWPRFILRAGFDGKAFQATLALYRDACTNMMEISRVGASFHRSIRHTSSLRASMPSMVEDFRELATGWEDMQATIASMNEREVVLKDFIRSLYPAPVALDAGAANTRYDNRIAAILTRVLRDRNTLGVMGSLGRSIDKVTAWEAYNAVQGYVQHDMPRRGNPSKLDRALKGLNEPIVKKALELALSPELVIAG